MSNKIKVSSNINKDILTVWNTYHQPKHIEKWNYASDTWHTPKAESDFKVGGRFTYRMEAKDGSSGFDFTGQFDLIDSPYRIKYHLEDQREVDIKFKENGEFTYVEVVFDAENENSVELQKRGWQSIVNNFKKYVESL
jgi:uncharacterized protein YndB with AHSA1/START domain